MAIIAFCGNSKKETGQTLTMASIASVMAIDHNYKILIIGTDYNDSETMEDCFWPRKEEGNNIQSMLGLGQKENIGTVSGVEGLARVIQSGRTGKDIIGNYASPVFKEKRLDLLVPPKTTSREIYNTLCGNYIDILKMAKLDYNMIFIDVSREMSTEIKNKILEMSDIVAVGIKQDYYDVENFAKLRRNNSIYNKNNIMIFIGRYDGYSKYNIKNLERYFKSRNMVFGLSYNTLFYESATEGKMIDYFFKMRNISNSDNINAIFMDQNRYACENIIYKIRELHIG